MNTELFFAWMAVSVVSYGAQLPLLIYYARTFDALTTTIYRNLSLALTMLPVLFLAPPGELGKLAPFAPLLLLASLVGAGTFMLNLSAARFLPVGVAYAVRQATYTLAAIVLGVVVFAEFLSPPQLAIIALILAFVVALTLSKPAVAHLPQQNAPRGIALAVLAGVGYALGFLIFSHISRSVSPLVVGYFWEVGIGVAALMIGLVRQMFYKKRIQVLSARDTFKIAAISTTTISGTLSFGFAINHGPYSLASSLITTTGLIALLGGYVLFKERLTKRQVGLVLAVIATIMALRFLS